MSGSEFSEHSAAIWRSRDEERPDRYLIFRNSSCRPNFPVPSGATSLWETCFGGDDFNYAGSLCHGWSCVIPYFCRRCILGVTPLKPGFAEFEVRPYPAKLSFAAGSVPTPRGEIRVEWQKNDAGLRVRVEHPAGLKCVPAQWEEAPVAEWKICMFQP